MKRLFAICLLILATIISIQAHDHDNGKGKGKNKAKKSKTAKGGDQSFGAAITKEGAVKATDLTAQMKGKDKMDVNITGKIVSVCQVKGCWMQAELGNGKTMRIRFKDYGFFVPKDAGSKTFYAQGIASWDTTSVAELQHYAADAGKSKEEIAKITEPQVELVFLADGVIIEGKKD
jgi:hypothetical protein